MPLTILMLLGLAIALLGLGLPSALLLASALAPTDPVLASDVQVGTPSEDHEDEPRFALTSEAGLNDGMAFPFVNLAIVAAGAGGLTISSFLHWLAIDVLWKILLGAGIGGALGGALGWLTFHLPNKSKLLAETEDGFVALGVACLTYGIVQAVDGYGFVGVFVAAVALRYSHRGHDYHRRMHDYAEELERLLMMVLLVGFGATMVGGGFLKGLTWSGVAFASVTILLVRPIAGWLSLSGSARPRSERFVISFFGVRGLGTAYYLAYGLEHGSFKDEPTVIWATAALTVLMSIVLHGVFVTSALQAVDGRRDLRVKASGNR